MYTYPMQAWASVCVRSRPDDVGFRAYRESARDPGARTRVPEEEPCRSGAGPPEQTESNAACVEAAARAMAKVSVCAI